MTEIVKSAAGILQSDDRETIATKLDQFIDGLPTQDPDELRTIAAALANVLGIPMTPRGTYAAGEIAQAELHWGLRRTAHLLAVRQPTVFVFEDMHWAEPTFIELLQYLTTPGDGTPLLAVRTARPEFLEADAAFAGGVGSQRVQLDVLPPRAGTALLSELIGDSELAETHFAETLVANAGQSAVPRGDRSHAERQGHARGGKMEGSKRAWDAAGADEPSGPDQFAP